MVIHAKSSTFAPLKTDDKNMKVKRRWIILMTAMTLIAIAGLAVGEPSFECDWSVISAADVAWLKSGSFTPSECIPVSV